MRDLNWKKHAVAIIVTIVIFSTAFLVSDFLNTKRVEELRSIQDRIALDILAAEVQSSLLSQTACPESGGSVLSNEINSLSTRLSFLEETRGADDPEVRNLKEYYSLLEIKDYLLMKRIAKTCSQEPVFVLYFYSNKGDCEDCTKMGHVLSYLRETYPQLRIYTFDYNLGVSAVDTLRTMTEVKNELPAIVVDDKTYYGFKPVEEIENLLNLASTTATTTVNQR